MMTEAGSMEAEIAWQGQREDSVSARLCAWLVMASLILVWCAGVLTIETMVKTVSVDDDITLVENKPPLQYLCYGLGILAMLLAGGIGFFKCLTRKQNVMFVAAFYLLFVIAVTWALVGYAPSEILSRKIFAPSGPFAWMTLGVPFAAFHIRNWGRIIKCIAALAYLSLLLGIREILSGSHYERIIGLTKPLYYGIQCFLYGGFLFIYAHQWRGLKSLLGRLPFLGVVPLCIYAQNRSWIIDSILVVFLDFILRMRYQLWAGTITLFRVMQSLVVYALAAIMLVAVVVAIVPESAFRGLYERRFEDTRSGQYTTFFKQIPPSSLILGNGPKATYKFNGIANYQFIDNGYLWILFIGGAPTLILYLFLIVLPGYACLRYPLSNFDRSCVVLIILWSLTNAGLSVFCGPVLDSGISLVSILAGRCYYLRHLHAQGLRKVKAEKPAFAQDGLIYEA